VHQEEIAKTLCIQREMKENKCNGHCFLSKQLKKAAEKEKKETQNLKEKQEVVYLPTHPEKVTKTSISICKSRLLVSPMIGKPTSTHIAVFHPPLV
jgi:hypothetical protein